MSLDRGGACSPTYPQRDDRRVQPLSDLLEALKVESGVEEGLDEFANRHVDGSDLDA
jgi:hypothetical protein